MTSEIPQGFAIHYNFPVHFTRDLFSDDNFVFVDTVRRLEPGKRHRVLFVVDENVVNPHSSLLSSIERYCARHSESIVMAGPPVPVVGGEAAKNDLEHVFRLAEQINGVGLDRQSFVAVIGGGAVLDMACFVTAISHRGIRTIRIPTTVLSQADSGVGVKNGINWFGKKNFFGTFVPPFAVINDSSFIDTLEKRDKIAGIAEAVKVALIRNRSFYTYLEDNAHRLAAAEPQAVNYQIRRTAELHLQHIGTSGDPFEFGSARPLDFGHWVAHKLESMTGHRLRHGEAVAIGMAVDCVYSAKMGYLKPEHADRVIALLQKIGFRLWDDMLLERDFQGQYAILTGLQEFREHLGGNLTITLLRDIGVGFEVHEMDARVVLESIESLRRQQEQLGAGEGRHAGAAK